jgi:homoserine O-acetyltransferase
VAEGFRAGGVDSRFLPLPSPQGHDAFLVDLARFGPAVRDFLEG